MTDVLVTGGAGFVGSALVRALLARGDRVVTVDALTYAAHPDTVAELRALPNHTLVHADIGDADAMAQVFQSHAPSVVFNLAAETHVDRSIDGPGAFVRTNVLGTGVLLDGCRAWLAGQSQSFQQAFRFIQASTDEVFGSLGETGVFTADSPYAPRSPYAASKAGADHLVRAWFHTWGLPVLITHASNTYGPRQFPEKLIPHLIRCARAGLPLPLYGDGLHRRTWQHVEDHVGALLAVADRGRVGASYTLGGGKELANLDLVSLVCDLLDALAPDPDGSHARRITRVADRPGHDRRYALDDRVVTQELGWQPAISLSEGLRSTVQWYLDHPERLGSPGYDGLRLGTAS